MESPDKSQRELLLDSTYEGGMTWPGGDLVLAYQHFWQLVQLNENLKIKRALFIGAGAFGMPEQVSKANPDAMVDVAEIDPAVIQTGREYFKLNEFPNVRAHASDARRFLQSSDGQKYDFIFGDAYNGVRHIPAHLVTKEFFTQVHDRLAPHGVFIMNVISAIEGPRSELTGHVIATLREVFPHVEIFGVGGSRMETQNVILLASDESWKPWIDDRTYPQDSWQSRLLSSRVPPMLHPPHRAVLTDDWNPIDVVIARQLGR